MKLTPKVVLTSVAAFAALATTVVPSNAAGVSASSFNTSFSTMASLKSVVAAGKGSIAVILPDSKSSARYTEFDAPYLTQAFKAAGVKKFSVQNAQGSDTTFFTDAQAAIAKGAKVLVIDPIDSTTGATVEGYAKGRGVAVIDYDRLTLGGARSYYVSFDNVQVGKTIGQGELDCQKAWGVTSPVTYISYGSPTDNNATLFAQGYNAVLTAAGFNTSATTLSGAKQTVLENAGTWDGPTAANDFEAAY
jgi:D-xylose transport system substrate-binding protein